MKNILILVAIIATCWCADVQYNIPASPVAPAVETMPTPGLIYHEVRDEAGQYSISYRTHDQAVSEQALLKRNEDNRGNVLVKQGTYTYISPEGQPISLTYVADENGFQPLGNHLPQPLPIVP